MGELVKIGDYYPTCRNCKFGAIDKKEGPDYWICTRPGGWHFDAKFRYCAFFERREDAL